MKILVNSQDKAVGGIVRMMNTFVESVIKVDLNISFHFAIASSSKNLATKEEEIHSKSHYGFPADHLILSSDYYPHAVERSSSLEDLRINLSLLIDFYLRSIEKSKPDVVLINGTYYRPWALLQAARQKKIPYVVYVHGSIIQEAKGVLEPTLSLLKEMEKDFYANNTDYIFPSSVAQSGTLFSDRITQNKSHIIYNPLDEVFFTPKKSQRNLPYTVGFALRWEDVKNTSFILDFIQFNKTAPNPYLIKIVSDLDAEKSALFQDKFTEFLPPKTKMEMVKFYQETDIIVNPSFFETFGYVPAEAVAGGTPAIISASQGISEVFLKCGLERMISDFSDVSKIHKKILDIIRDSVTKKEIGTLRTELDPINLSKKILSVLSQAAKF